MISDASGIAELAETTILVGSSQTVTTNLKWSESDGKVTDASGITEITTDCVVYKNDGTTIATGPNGANSVADSEVLKILCPGDAKCGTKDAWEACKAREASASQEECEKAPNIHQCTYISEDSSDRDLKWNETTGAVTDTGGLRGIAVGSCKVYEAGEWNVATGPGGTHEVTPGDTLTVRCERWTAVGSQTVRVPVRERVGPGKCKFVTGTCLIEERFSTTGMPWPDCQTALHPQRRLSELTERQSQRKEFYDYHWNAWIESDSGRQHIDRNDNIRYYINSRLDVTNDSHNNEKYS